MQVGLTALSRESRGGPGPSVSTLGWAVSFTPRPAPTTYRNEIQREASTYIHRGVWGSLGASVHPS